MGGSAARRPPPAAVRNSKMMMILLSLSLSLGGEKCVCGNFCVILYNSRARGAKEEDVKMDL